jgi:DNA-binding LacI/PurR family transcriptional regulator
MTRRDAMRVAVEANCDPRTVQRFVNGDEIRPSSVERIEAAVKKLKIDMGGGAQKPRKAKKS